MRGTTAVALSCIVVFAGVAVALFRYGDRIGCGDDPDWTAWRETTSRDSGFGADEGEDRRRDAARHIEACGSLRGRHRREVRRLLGKPGETSPAVRGDHTFYSYYLGPDWLGLDAEWLTIEFNGDGRVIRVDDART